MLREVDTRRPQVRAAQERPSPRLDTTLVLWLTLFVFGGGLLALYYAGIGYFPEVSWQDALTYLALMTILGGSLVTAYCILLFVPGVIWSKYLVDDEEIGPALTMATRPGVPCVWSIGKRIVIPFSLFMAFCHSLLLLRTDAGDSPAFVVAGVGASLSAVTYLFWQDVRTALETATPMPIGSPPREDLWVAALHAPLLAASVARALNVTGLVPEALAMLAILPLAGWPILRARPSDPAAGQQEIPDRRSVLCRAILAFDSAALASLAALWFFHRIYRGGGPDVPPALLLLCTVAVIVTNLAVCVVFRDSWRWALAASFITALVLLGAGQLLGPADAGLSARIMERFGFGGGPATLVLTEKGGLLLCQHGFPVQFAEPSPSCGAAAEPGSSSGTAVEPTPSPRTVAEPAPSSSTAAPPDVGPFARANELEILSRLGTEYVLRSRKRTLTLPKSEVVSWSTGQGPLISSNCPPLSVVVPLLSVGPPPRRNKDGGGRSGKASPTPPPPSP